MEVTLAEVESNDELHLQKGNIVAQILKGREVPVD